MLTLSPAYDICPQGRTGNEATQAMLIKGDNRMSTLASCLAAAPDFLLTDEEAVDIIAQQIITIAGEWDAVCGLANLSATDKALFGGRQFLNPYCIEGLSSDHDALTNQFKGAREQLLA
jgi:serine/threonine-protein kinase HipA